MLSIEKGILTSCIIFVTVKVPEAKCPKRKLDASLCPGEKFDKCSTDSDCDKGFKCCIEFCDKECLRECQGVVNTKCGLFKVTPCMINDKIFSSKYIFNRKKGEFTVA